MKVALIHGGAYDREFYTQVAARLESELEPITQLDGFDRRNYRAAFVDDDTFRPSLREEVCGEVVDVYRRLKGGQLTSHPVMRAAGERLTGLQTMAVRGGVSETTLLFISGPFDTLPKEPLIYMSREESPPRLTQILLNGYDWILQRTTPEHAAEIVETIEESLRTS